MSSRNCKPSDGSLPARLLSKAINRRLAMQGAGALLLSRSVLACADQRDRAPQRGTAGSPGPASGGADAGRTKTSDIELLDCVMTPEMVEGPFFTDLMLNRSDLVAGAGSNVTSGLPLRLGIQVLRVDGDQCVPVEGAQVDIWHADVNGLYSGFAASVFQMEDTSSQDFLRGYQVTDADGSVEFHTIFPGWYESRTIHIHFKVRASSDTGESYELTSQLYFDDVISDAIIAMPPYNTRGERVVSNMNDQVFNGTGQGLGPDPTPPPNGKAPGAVTLVKASPLAAGTRWEGQLKLGLRMS